MYDLAPEALNWTVKGTPAGTDRYFLSVNLAVTLAVTFTVRPFLTGSGLALALDTFALEVAVGPVGRPATPGGAHGRPSRTRLVAPRTGSPSWEAGTVVVVEPSDLRAEMNAASSVESTGLGVNSSGTPADAATAAVAQPCGVSGSSMAEVGSGKAAPIAREAPTVSAPANRVHAPGPGIAASGSMVEAATVNGRPARAATVSAGTEVGAARRTGTPCAAASAAPATAWAGDPSGETRTAEAVGPMRAATAAAVAASFGPASRVTTGTPSAETAAAVASATTPGPPTTMTSPAARDWMSAATSGASDPAGVISRGAPRTRANGAAATPAAREAVPASDGPVRTTVVLLGAAIRPHRTEAAGALPPDTRLAFAHGPHAPPGAGVMVRSVLTVATGVPSAATPDTRTE